MNIDLTKGNITKKLILFSLPLMAGNILQQAYNIADTLIVGRFIGETALAAVGSAYTLMTFITSVIIGLCMGSGAFFSIQFGRKDNERLNNGIFISFAIIGSIAFFINVFVFIKLDWIIRVLNVPIEVVPLIREYLFYIFMGIMASFLYNYFANLLRAVGNSIVPLLFLGVASLMNIGLDILFVLSFNWGVKGAAIATVIAQYFAGIGLALYYFIMCPGERLKGRHIRWRWDIIKELIPLCGLTCIQQSVMNFGILMIQGLVNTFGKVVMAAFAAGVKIDTVAYMPVQDIGNAFSTFVAQNFGAGEKERIKKGIKSTLLCIVIFSAVISICVVIFAEPLMGIFVPAENADTIAVGVSYLRIEACFYFAIGILFALYGYYRAVKKPWMSLVLTVCSLGTRVLLANIHAPIIGVMGIWMSIPIGWILADMVGVLAFEIYNRKQKLYKLAD